MFPFLVRRVFWRGRAQLSWAGKELLLQDCLATSITTTHRITDWITYWLDGWRTPSSPVAPSSALSVWGLAHPSTSTTLAFFQRHSLFPPAPLPYLVFSFWYEFFSSLWLNNFFPTFSPCLCDLFIVGLCHPSLWELYTACYFILVWNFGFCCRVTTMTAYKHTKQIWRLESSL